jgi:hypothetical protein
LTNPNLELLAAVHEQQVVSSDLQTVLSALVVKAAGEDVALPAQTVRDVVVALRGQSTLVAKLVEQNLQIVDRIEQVIAKLEKS